MMLCWLRIAALGTLPLLLGCRASSTPERPSSKVAEHPPTAPALGTAPSVPRVVASVVEQPGERFKYVFRGSLFANLFYFVDCVSGATNCSREAFDKLAQEELGGLSDADRSALATWKTIRGRYRGRITPADDPDELPLPLPHSHRQVERRVRLAGYTSTTPTEYEAKLAMFADAPDPRRAADVLEHFIPRFARYWDKAEPRLARMVEAYAARARQPELRQLISRIAGFYDSEVPPGTELTFELVLRPETPRTTAEQLATISLVEVVEGERPDEQLGVVFHELFHYLLSRVPTKRLAPLVDRFAKSDDRFAYAGFGVLDEALATVFGNGLVVRQLDPPALAKRLARANGLYTDAVIDRTAKALLPVADGILSRSTTVRDAAFYDTYIEAAHLAFPEGLPPRALLRPFVAAYSPDFEPSMEILHDLANTAQSASTSSLDPTEARETLDERPAWTRLLMMKRTDVAAIGGWKALLSPAALADLATAAKKRPAFVYADLPKGKPAVFLFVADTPDEMTKLVRRFAAVPTLRAGVLSD